VSSEIYKRTAELKLELDVAQANATAFTVKSQELEELLAAAEAKITAGAEEAAAQITGLEAKIVERANAAASKVAALKKSMRTYADQAANQTATLTSEVTKLKQGLQEALSKASQAKSAEETAVTLMVELQGELEIARAEAIKAIDLQEELEEAREEFIKAQVVEAQVAELQEELERTRIKAVKGDVLETEVMDLRERLRKTQAEAAKTCAEVDKMRRGVTDALAGGQQQFQRTLVEIKEGDNSALTPQGVPGGAVILRLVEPGSVGRKVLRFASLAPLISKLQPVLLPIAAQVLRFAVWAPLLVFSGTAMSMSSVSKRSRGSSDSEPEIYIPSGIEEF
jgi:predicted DNA-binding WGR domain protein